MSINSPPPVSAEGDIDRLLAAGDHAKAAKAAEAAGLWLRAADIYERIWDWAGAAAAARRGGDLPRALRCAIEGRLEPLVTELTAALTVHEPGSRTALDVLARGRRHSEAAALAERLGETERAIDLYQRAGRLLDAARLLEAAGRDRDAGRLLERAIDLSASDEAAIAHLRLGRILAARASYRDAARHLQLASRSAEARAEAQRHLIPALAALGLRDGAREVLIELRQLDPEVTLDLDRYLRSWRDAVPRPAAAPSHEMIGGRFRLERLLGAGAAGRVFAAYDEVAARHVAIKLLHSARGSTAIERFAREAKLAASMRHPALVEVYEVSVESGYLVMELLADTLAQRLGNGERLSSMQARRLTLELLGGLESAHHRGVVHRDVKPANIFFDQSGSAKLGDFGVAHLVDLGQTQTGGLIGTLAYMSPEQITGAPITVVADLYSLGITLFEALTGRLPFLGPDFVAQHLAEVALPPSAIHPELGTAWDPIVAAMLAKSSDERPSLEQVRRMVSAVDGNERTGPAVGLSQRYDDRATAATSSSELAREHASEQSRYAFETPLGETAISTLTRALDTVLDRSVVVERFANSEAGLAALARVRRLARAASPFIQRALSLDTATRTVVFEAPAGAPVTGARVLSRRDALRLFQRLARGIAALHGVDVAHGAINPGAVVVDDAGIPTITVAGSGPDATLGAAAAGDVQAAVGVVATLLDVDATLEAVFRAMDPGCVVPAALKDGAALYRAVIELELGFLRSEQA